MDESPNHGATAYEPPVRQLLGLGEPASHDPAEWPDTAATFGLGPEHVGELIRMACDMALHQADSMGPEVWAPTHAWRALGRMRAEPAAAPLLALLRSIEADDAMIEDLPVVLGMIGPAAIPPITRFLADPPGEEMPSLIAVAGIKEIGTRHPESRSACIGVLTGVLERKAGADPTVNGFAVSALMDLHAAEAIDAIRGAFRRDAVDISVAGDLEDVEIGLGLRKQRATPRPRYATLPASWPAEPEDADIKPVRQGEKIGRNDPCPCGSGKKYKKCCLRAAGA